MNVIITVICSIPGCHAENKFDVIDGAPALKRCKICDAPITFMIHDIEETQRVTEMLEHEVKLGKMTRTFRNGQYVYQQTNQSKKPT